MVESGGAYAIIGTLVSVIVLAGKAIIDTLNRSSQRVTLLEAKLDNMEKEREMERQTAERERSRLRDEIEVMRDELRQMQIHTRMKDEYTVKVEQQRDTYKAQIEALKNNPPSFSNDENGVPVPGKITGIIVEPATAS